MRAADLDALLRGGGCRLRYARQMRFWVPIIGAVPLVGLIGGALIGLQPAAPSDPRTDPVDSHRVSPESAAEAGPEVRVAASASDHDAPSEDAGGPWIANADTRCGDTAPADSDPDERRSAAGPAKDEDSPARGDATGAVIRLPAVSPSKDGTNAVAGRVVLQGAGVSPPALSRGLAFGCPAKPTPDPSLRITDGAVTGAVVRLLMRDFPLGGSSDEPEVVLGDCMFEPHVSIAHATCGGFRVRNGDTTAHAVVAMNDSEVVFRRTLYPGNRERVFLSRFPPVLRLSCELHPWESAYVVNNPSNFATITDDRGQYRLADVPDGIFVVETWHERLGTTQTTVSVARGQIAELTPVYGPEALRSAESDLQAAH